MFPNAPNISLKLLQVTSPTDSIGIKKFKLKNSKEVVGINFSITSKEYYNNKKESLNIKLAVKINHAAYDGSLYVLIKKSIYKIERTYADGIWIELYLSETNFKESDFNG